MTPKDVSRPTSGLWKDFLDRPRIRRFAEVVRRHHRPFDTAAYVNTVCDREYRHLELKDRILKMARSLRPFLPDDYRRAVGIILKAAPHTSEFENWVLGTFVSEFGLEDFDTSVPALGELTKYGTSEFAIRPFVNRYTEKILPVLHRWANDENEHVRRLAAEGSRPRGVWTEHIEAFRRDPRPVVEILTTMKADPSLYVRKAVANNLNDIGKEHPDLLLATARLWKRDRNAHTDWIIRHACRSLIKDGHPEVFPLLGFTANPRITLHRLSLKPRRVAIGGDIVISFDILSKSKRRQKLAVDYRVIYNRPGSRTSSKVFKLAEKSLPGGEQLSVSRRHSFKDTSGRTHHPGKHRLEIVINGKTEASAEIALTSNRR